jgi:beta-barrel assembly-enhancing protease
MGPIHASSADRYGLSRRRFLWLTAAAAAGAATGCASNPVTGQTQLMMVSEQEEIQIDRQYSPMQFSSDYGPVQDASLNAYVDGVGKSLASRSHRTHMPFSFRVVNATYVNAYAFPAGSIACTRGILLKLNNEAELAALMGHELGHVNARHTASALSKGMLTQTVVGGLSILAGTQGAVFGEIASQLGGVGAGALLASYSRDNERQADALGTRYMVQAGYGPEGMVGLMNMLQNLSQSKPGSVEILFSTHPMSAERYQNAVDAVRTQYASAMGLPLHRERYMDQTAGLRSMQETIDELQNGEKALGAKKFSEAEEHYLKALKRTPGDYAALVMMATCRLVQKDYVEGLRYADEAKAVYPQEAQGHHLSGFARLHTRDFERAYRDFAEVDRLLPGNPSVIFFKGYAQEGMNRRHDAAREFRNYLQQVQSGQYAQHAYRRLREWGYAR